MKKITKEEFEKIYYGNSNYIASKKLNISQTTLIYYAKKFGFRKGSGLRKIKITEE